MDRLTHIENKLTTLLEKTMYKRGHSKNASLSVKSAYMGMDIEIVRGEDTPLNPMRPQYMASVGKLFTATLIAILKDEGKLDFDDPAYKHLEKNALDGIHVLKEVDHSKTITIRQLMMHTSGLPDVFWDLLSTLPSTKESMEPKQLLEYVKDNTTAKYLPGKKASYADTNYYILGLIIEHITGKQFHTVMHEKIFEKAGMDRAFLLSQSHPEKTVQNTVSFHIGGLEGLVYPNYGWIDYAGGSVTAPLEDFNGFMSHFAEGTLLRDATKNEMVETTRFLYPTIRYGMGVWVLKAPLFDVSKMKYAYGVFGVTGSFLVYHPKTRSVISGSFNDDAFRMEAVRFVMRVIRLLINV